MDLRSFVESSLFERVIVTIIALNAVGLGLETIQALPQEVQNTLVMVDRIFLAIFTLEILLKLAVYRLSYFRDPWRVFDFAIVGISLVPASGPFSVLRSLRILRALRMISVVPSLRRVVSGLLRAIPGLGAVGAILSLIFYVGAVMATKLFGPTFPDWFGSIAKSAYTLFQVMTLESWSMGIVRPVMEQHPLAWLYFLPFILVTTFTMLNLFIAVIVNGLHAETDEAADVRAKEGHHEREKILEELAALHRKIDGLANKR